ncbi:DUF4129 domain-containing protein [Niabella beijingensis]|uniref:DUF4129 domain-containing protein n=1 Tax=Niabella beijingensis TaxID=2872700 RepID=UPI001CBC97C8|nr:hypothetical protein [Niabella beijingensis]MBZ4188540.1 hypothetical protein [Niabella beijingensis]
MYKLKNAFLFCGILFLLLPAAAFSQSNEEDEITEDSTSIVDIGSATDKEPAASFKGIEYFENDSSAVRSVPDSFVRRLHNDADFGYVKTGLKPENKASSQQTRGPVIGSGFFSLLPYIAIALFIIILVWYLSANQFILFRKKSTALPVSHTEEASRDIFSIDYAASIRQALQQKNYRLAIRLQYLELLKKLSDRQLIHFLPDKTNFEYLTQMRSSKHYQDFFTATRHYEYSWYGLFDISENMYQKINDTFQQLKQKL